MISRESAPFPFGFAGALTELGLPQGEITLALFAFNVGVEIGQLAFIAVVLTVIAIAHRIDGLVRMRGYVMTGTSYAIGSLASFWFIERVAQMVYCQINAASASA